MRATPASDAIDLDSAALTLPENPHLDHLKSQAKALLAELRTAHPGSILSDAQYQLARDYGFASWRTLKAEVEDRRRGKLPGGIQLGHVRNVMRLSAWDCIEIENRLFGSIAMVMFLTGIAMTYQFGRIL